MPRADIDSLKRQQLADIFFGDFSLAKDYLVNVLKLDEQKIVRVAARLAVIYTEYV